MRSVLGYYRPGQSYPRRILREEYPRRPRTDKIFVGVPGGGYNLYIGSGHPDKIDYVTPIATVSAGTVVSTMSVAALGLVEGVDYYIDVLAESVAHVESLTGGPVHVRIESGVLVTPRPNAIAIAAATAAAAGKVHLDALYDATDELDAATKVVVGRLVDDAIDWASPVQEIAISGTTTIDEDLSDTYTDIESVHLAVRAETAAGVQGPVTVLATVVADATAPDAPAELAAAQE